MLTAKSRISAECPRYSLIIFPERASQRRTAPSRLQVYTTAELSSHSSCTIPDWDREDHSGDLQQVLALLHVHPTPHGVCHPHRRTRPKGQAHLLRRDCGCPLGKPKAKGEVQSGNWPLGSEGDLQKAQSPPPRPREGGRVVPHVDTYALGSVWRGHK